MLADSRNAEGVRLRSNRENQAIVSDSKVPNVAGVSVTKDRIARNGIGLCVNGRRNGF